MQNGETASGRRAPRSGRERGAEDAHRPGGDGARPRSLRDSGGMRGSPRGALWARKQEAPPCTASAYGN